MPTDHGLSAVHKANPWAEKAEAWLSRPQKEYFLEADKELLRSTIGTKLHLNLPPQPFIGNPDAPVWILGISPSVNPLDVYDQCDAKREGLPHLFRFSGKEEKAQLNRRRELLFRQLTLKGDLPFYVLDEAFHTVEQPRGRTIAGAYAWWHRCLIGKKGVNRFFADTVSVSRNCFALELFPYHYEGTPTRELVLGTAHFHLWKMLLAYAQATGKVLIARKTVANWLTRLNLPTDNLLLFASQSAALTTRNVKPFAGHTSAADILSTVINP